MALLSANEQNEGRNGSSSIEDYQRTSTSVQTLSAYGKYTRVYVVIFDSIENAKTARDAAGVPALGDAYPTDADSHVVSKNAVAEEGVPYCWRVTVEYDRNDSPILEPWEVEYDEIVFSKAATKDKDGNPIQNSAKQPFDPAPEIDDDRWRLIISRNSSYTTGFDPNVAKAYRGAVNNATVTIHGVNYPVRTLKCVSWKAKRFHIRGTYYWKETIIVEYDPSDWQLKIVDAGFVDKNGKDKIIPSTGARSSKPWPLDGAGLFKAVFTDLTILNFKVYPELDFTPLNLNYA